MDKYLGSKYSLACYGYSSFRIADKENIKSAVRFLIKESINARKQADLNYISREFCVSVRTFSRKLKSVGLCYRDILKDVRMEESIRLLTSSDEPVQKISDELLYSDSSNFVKAFKSWTGVTPGEYRLQKICNLNDHETIL